MTNVVNAMGQPMRMSALLGQVALIVTIRTSCLGLTRTDKTASDQSTVEHNAIVGAGRVVANRLAGADAPIKKIRAIQKEAQDMGKGLSTDWNGRRLMPNVNLEVFLREFNHYEAKFNHEVDQLVADAPRLIAQARANLGSYSVEPPSLAEIKSAFRLDYVCEPIPDMSRYSASNLDSLLQIALRDQFEANTEAAYAYAQQDVLQRVAAPLQALVERLSAFDARVAAQDKGEDVKGGFFRDTIITNVQDIANVFGSFNLFNDPALIKLDNQLKEFFKFNAKDLREDQSARTHLSTRASEILAQLDGYL